MVADQLFIPGLEPPERTTCLECQLEKPAHHTACSSYVPPKLVKVNLGCGQTKQPDEIGVDIAAAPGVDVVHDLFTFPWPFEDDSVDEISCSHFFEHVPSVYQRLVQVVDGITPPYYKLVTENIRFQFMDECWRILKLGGKLFITCPYAQSHRAVQDPTHTWPPIVEASFLYFSQMWRLQNKLDHYPVTCNFDTITRLATNAAYVGRNHEALDHMQRAFWNAVDDIYALCTKIAKIPKAPQPPPTPTP